MLTEDQMLREWGAVALPSGEVRFRVWAPDTPQVDIELTECAQRLPMVRQPDGWHQLVTDRAAPGTLYSLVLPGDRRVADPASAFQPQGVQGPSEVIDPAGFVWAAEEWTGRPWHEVVLYELHVGTFTPEGTFKAAIARLPYLTALGITAIELMPVAQFAGSRNWGYDGVLPYAPACCYGRPEDLQALIDAAHAAGISVILDVVYNHLGPEGNPLGAIAPAFYTKRHQTPWGAAFNFEDSRAVRSFFIDNALYWLEHYRIDGLRLDAVHAIVDDSPEHIIDEIARVVRARVTGRHVHLILENEHNEAHRLTRDGGSPTRYTAQWNDDVHHVLHVAATGESEGYYGDYVGDTSKLARALAQGFAFQGEAMHYRGSARGEPSGHLPPPAFIAFLQNHDQVGNRAFGDRLGSAITIEQLRALAALYLLLPQIPMLFMGEEWAASTPFPFFCDFSGELAAAVTAGRRAEFARFAAFSDPAQRERIPDPVDPATAASARLDWNERHHPLHATVLAHYRAVLAVRHARLVPLLPAIPHGGHAQVTSEGVVRVNWPVQGHGDLELVANLQSRPATLPAFIKADVLWCEGSWIQDRVAPWTIHWSLRDVAPGG